MTDTTHIKLLEEMDALVERLRDFAYKDAYPEAESGKVVWPPKAEMDTDDMLATLFDIEDCDLSLTFYDKDGTTMTHDLSVVFSGTELYPGSPGIYSRKPLKEMLQEEHDLHVEAGFPETPSARLFARLLQAFRDWEENEGKES